MRKVLFIITFILSIQVWGQQKTDFTINIPDKKIESSKYNKLYYIESRSNPKTLGYTFNSMSGGKDITLHESLEDQLTKLIKNTTDQSAELKTLAVQIRKLDFGHGTTESKGKNLCRIRITLYEKDGFDSYYFLNTLDTVVYGSYKEIRDEASNSIASFIVENLPYLAYDDEQAIDRREVMNIDEFEKNSLLFYKDEKIPDGVYFTYKSLMGLTPDIATELSIKEDEDGKLKEVKMPDPAKDGKERKLKADKVYAVVKDGTPYVNFMNDFYETYFDKGDWKFTIAEKVSVRGGFSIGFGIGSSGGGMGVGIPIGGKSKKIYTEITIDHLNGDFIEIGNTD